MTTFQWIVILFGGGGIITGAGVLIMVGRKLQKFDDMKEEMKKLEGEIVLRTYCKERHGEIEKKQEKSEQRFEKIESCVTQIHGNVQKILGILEGQHG